MTGPSAIAEWTEERFSDEWVKAWHVFKRRGYADYEAGRCAALHARSQEQFLASGGSGEAPAGLTREQHLEWIRDHALDPEARQAAREASEEYLAPCPKGEAREGQTGLIELTEALSFYADEKNWLGPTHDKAGIGDAMTHHASTNTPLAKDRGERARAALRGQGEGE